MTSFNQHEAKWTNEQVSNYWDYVSTNPHLSSLYFTKQVGKAVARDFIRNCSLEGRELLDFGCGPGNLFKGLNEFGKNFNYTGADFSSTSINLLKESFKNEKNFKDAFHIGGFPTTHVKQYDYIICCEVIEHLDDNTLECVSQEFKRLLKPGGILYITTPNDEDLESAKSMCPECGCIFHRWQHVRSWNKNSINSYFSRLGFQALSTKTINYDNNPVKAAIKTVVKTYILKKAPRSLVYIARKPI
jgi:2-polyprenyl-3-methyl-5-hydroxy-6-metoxy-1,4-benzoquinol methylase